VNAPIRSPFRIATGTERLKLSVSLWCAVQGHGLDGQRVAIESLGDELGDKPTDDLLDGRAQLVSDERLPSQAALPRSKSTTVLG